MVCSGLCFLHVVPLHVSFVFSSQASEPASRIFMICIQLYTYIYIFTYYYYRIYIYTYICAQEPRWTKRNQWFYNRSPPSESLQWGLLASCHCWLPQLLWTAKVNFLPSVLFFVGKPIPQKAKAYPLTGYNKKKPAPPIQNPNLKE